MPSTAISTTPAEKSRRLDWVTAQLSRMSALRAFRRDEIVDGFAAAHQSGLRAFDEHFGGAGTGVVIRAHGHPVGPGGHNREEVPCPGSDPAILGEEVGAFADRAHDVVNSARGRRFPNAKHIVPGAIER